jgi:Zn-dependent protease
VSSTPSNLTQKCKGCSNQLPPEALVCKKCHTLVHGAELDRLSAAARSLETDGQTGQAKERWERILTLLPEDSTQAEWVRERARRLQENAESATSLEAKQNWASKLGPFAPIAIALAKAKVLLSVFSFKFFFSLAAFIGVYWGLFGAKFGIGFAVLVLIHEMGHFIDVRRRGLPADMPIFLPGLGAYVRWKALGVSLQTRAEVSLAGPFAGWVAALVCTLIWWKTGNNIWAALARASAWLNVLNLIPVWMLDGGQAVLALNKAERVALLTASLILWFASGEGVFFLVAAGVGYRLFTKDMPPNPSRAATTYFVGVLACLAYVLWVIPGKGFGTP